MAVPMPSWVDVNPRDFVSAAEAGAKLGIASQTASDRGEQAAAEGARIAAQSAAQSQQHEIESQRLAMEHAQQQAELGLKQQQQQLLTQKAAEQFQAQQSYQSRVAQLTGAGIPSDKAAIQAAMEIGPGLLGESVGGLGTLQRADQATSFVPVGKTINGVDMIERAPGQWTQARLPAAWEQDIDEDGNPIQVNTVTGERKAAPGTQKPPTAIQNENEVIRLQSERDKLISNNERYAEKLDVGDPADPSWTKDQKAEYGALQKRLSGIDADISKFSGQSPDDSSMTNSTSSGLKYSIVPAQ